MGTIKDVSDLLEKLIDRINGRKKQKLSDLSELLGAISELLDDTRDKFLKRELPRKEAHALAILINNAEKILSHFNEELNEVEEVFKNDLNNIGTLLRDVDFFIDQKPRLKLHDFYKDKTNNASFPKFAAKKIDLACEEMERIIGKLNAHKITIKHVL